MNATQIKRSKSAKFLLRKAIKLMNDVDENNYDEALMNIELAQSEVERIQRNQPLRNPYPHEFLF